MLSDGFVLIQQSLPDVSGEFQVFLPLLQQLGDRVYIMVSPGHLSNTVPAQHCVEIGTLVSSDTGAW